MQTFLPYPDFEKSAKILDNKRLGKQRIEARQIINTLEGKSKGWIHHPAVKMWRGYEDALKLYFNAVAKEWITRGFKHNLGFFEVNQEIVYPPWLGKRNFHRSHKSNLVRKHPSYYRKFFPKVPDNLKYEWFNKTQKGRRKNGQ